MKKLKDFLVNSRRAIVWTIFYCLVMWSILRYLFNFDMLRAAHWEKLLTVELHGFAGLVFGILVLAAVPLYIATTILTVRNKSVPIKIPLPACFTPPPKPAEEPKIAPIVVEQEMLPELPHGVPAEMRDSFMRAKKNYGARQQSVFNRVGGPRPEVTEQKPASAPVTEPEPIKMVAAPITVAENAPSKIIENTVPAGVDENQEFPIPNDFDIDMDNVVRDYGIPVFSDINFDDDKTDADEENDSEKFDACAFLNSAGIDAKQDGDLTKTDKFVIAVHDDEEFWVADELSWFAAGKVRPSPIVELKKAHDTDGLTPVLYLASDTIMDLDKLIPEWQSAGITVVTSSDELLKVIGE